MDVYVAVTDTGLDGRHGGIPDDRGDQTGTAARDDHVDEPAGLDEMGDRRTVGAGQQLHRVGRQSLCFERGAQRGDERGIGTCRRGGTAQQRRVARLQRKTERVDGDVGAGLVDHPDDAERHPHLPQFESVGQRRTADDFADRVRQSGDLPQPRRDAVDACGREPQPVEERLFRTGRAGGVDVFGVGGEHGVGRGEHGVGGRVERGVLLGSGQQRKTAGRDAGAAGRGMHGFTGVSGVGHH